MLDFINVKISKKVRKQKEESCINDNLLHLDNVCEDLKKIAKFINAFDKKVIM